MDHEPARWSRSLRSAQSMQGTGVDQPGVASAGACPPQQLHLVSQGYPVRIRRALLASGLALALAVGGILAASVTSGGSVPTSEQSDAVVSVDVGS